MQIQVNALIRVQALDLVIFEPVDEHLEGLLFGLELDKPELGLDQRVGALFNHGGKDLAEL